MKHLNKIIFSLLFSYSAAFALVAGPFKIVGTIKSFDQKTVKVEGDEATYEIPRDYFNDKDIKPDNKVEVLLSQEQVEKIKTQKKKPVKK
jgi:hypothetical protein